MIRKGLTSDIDMILEITRACTNLMISQGIFQWNDHYPNRKAFEIDVMRNELFVLETENKIVGCIAISTLMDEEYVSVNWITPNKNNLPFFRGCCCCITMDAQTGPTPPKVVEANRIGVHTV